jgi:hypothetical protein
MKGSEKCFSFFHSGKVPVYVDEIKISVSKKMCDVERDKDDPEEVRSE